MTVSVLLLLIAGAAAFAAFALRLRPAADGNSTARATVLLVGGLLIFGLVVLVLFGLVLAGMQCDESCDPSSGEWQHTPGAWQWKAPLVLAGIGLAAMVVAARSAAVSRYRRAYAWTGLAAVATAAFVLLVDRV